MNHFPIITITNFRSFLSVSEGAFDDLGWVVRVLLFNLFGARSVLGQALARALSSVGLNK